MFFLQKCYRQGEVPEWFVRTGLVVGVLGLIDSAYLVVKHFAASKVVGGFCPLHEVGFIDCDRVTSSVYSYLLGVPLAVWGALFYFLVVLFFAIALRKKDPPWLLSVIVVATLASFAFSLWLMYAQIFKIGAVCTLCLISFGLSLVLFILDAILLIGCWKNKPWG